MEYSGYAPGPRTLPLMLDIEYDPYVASDGTNECYGLSASKMTSWISAFVTTARSLTGQYPIIYTTANWWDTCTGGAAGFGADPMWVAAYGFASPPMPSGWQDWSFWQYTSGGTVPGVDSAGHHRPRPVQPGGDRADRPGHPGQPSAGTGFGPARLARRADRREADLDGEPACRPGSG